MRFSCHAIIIIKHIRLIYVSFPVFDIISKNDDIVYIGEKPSLN